MKKVRLTVLISALVVALTSFAQVTMTGKVINGENGKSLEDAHVSVSRNDSIVAFAVTGSDGRFRIPQLEACAYTVIIRQLGFETLQKYVPADSLAVFQTFTLPKQAVKLDELVVEGDQSMVVTRTANGQKFYLSKEAKETENPFMALKEIPVLVSNDATNSVTMLDGSQPMVLIDGNWVNSGISPINPKDIESVEVIDVPGARFLKEGYRNVINIKLRRDRTPYMYFETATRHEVPLRNGFGVVYFEVGNKNVSLYGRSAINYTHDDKNETDIVRETSAYSQAFKQLGKTNGHDWLGELILKWRVSDKDYVAVHGYTTTKRFKNTLNGEGTITTGVVSPYIYDSRYRDNSKVWTASAYYRHTFAPGKDLEMRFAYNYNDNSNGGNRSDVYPDYTYLNDFLFKNNRNSGSFSLDYSNNAFSLGSKTTVNKDEINQVSEGYPVFNHRRWNEYVYGSYYGRVKRFQYMLSAGVDMVWLKAGDVENSYVRPRGSLSGTYSFNDNNSLQLSYMMDNSFPSEALLNPYNTSTDSLVVETGNPYLTPMMSHTVSLAYTFNRKGLYVSPGITYARTTDVIEAFGTTDGGIYTSSYRNYGYNAVLKTSADVSYRIKKWGRVYGGTGMYRDYYTGVSGKNAVTANVGFEARYKKLYFNMAVEYRSRAYSPLTRIKYNSPTYASAQVNFNIKKNLYVAVCIQSLDAYSQTMVTRDGDFYSWSKNRHTTALRPWILIRYSIRKNAKKKINLGNVLYNQESGISLKK